MRKLFSILFVLLFCTISFGQAAVNFQFRAEYGTANDTAFIAVGLDPAATDCIDPALGESDLPPFPPAGVYEIRFDLNTLCPGLSTYYDYRPATFPFTGTKQHVLWFQNGTPGSLPINLYYDLSGVTGSVSFTITDQIGGFVLNIGPFSGTGVATIPGSYTAVFNKAFLNMTYTNVAPAGPAPVFGIAPTSLNFGTVPVGSPSTLPVTVSNTGDADLVISAISSSDPQFTFAPSAPVTILPGGNQIFNITFNPTSAGPQSGNITFTHNAAGSPTLLPVQGTGTLPGPAFRVVPTSLNFGNVGVGTPENMTVTVWNDGSVNPMNITSASCAPGEYTVAPPNAVVPPLGSQVFTVTFTPTVPGIVNGTLTFVDDAPGSPHTVSLTGNGVAELGLIFQQDTVYRLEDNFYMDVMQLKATSQKIQSLQFRLYTNQELDDETILTFQSIQKGTDVSDASWILDYNIFRGPIQGNGASQDVIYVLLYNLNQDGGLPAGNYNDLLHVNYRVADLPALQDSIKSSFVIKNAEASTFEGFPVDITPSRDELTVIARNRVSSLGDVNGDGCLDILDLIMVVDHIVGRDSLDAAEFARADIAPWVPGNPLPDPDGFVNVQDLSLIQNIILTGVFPDGTPVGPCTYVILPKFNGDADAKVTLYINSEGITAYLDSKVGIRGAQIEFNNVVSDPGNMVINTDLGQGFYLRTDQLLRTLMYDRLGEKFIAAGEHFMADMPFRLKNADDVTLEKLILVDINKQILTKVQVEIIYGQAPVPYDYILYQNYPNPFNPSTSVRFQVPKTSDVTITIYDMLGQEVRTLFAGEVLRGTYTVDWDGTNNSGVKMSSGSYVYRMTAGEFVQSKKMVLVK